MKRTEYRFPARRKSRPALAALLTLGFAFVGMAYAGPSARPKTGGVLRVQLQDRISAIDPRQWPSDSRRAAAMERLNTLVFDRLVRLDDRGVPQAALALSWQHDASSMRWQFPLRKAVRFSDGSLLTPEATAPALQALLGMAFVVTATPDSVVIQADRSLPDFPAFLATGRDFIFHVADDGSLAGTGPFRVAEWPSGNFSGKAVLVANEAYWAGRPFVDKIEVKMGVDPMEQANAIAFGQADVAEIPASQVRRAAQRGMRIVSSEPVDLLALKIDGTRPYVADVRVRQAISLAVDRASIADVILQRQGATAGGMLPNWISGYAHLFPAPFDLPRAKELLTASQREHSRSSTLVLVYDSGDADDRAVADRLAVNLREVGIVVQVVLHTAGSKTTAGDIRLIRQRMVSPDSGVALSEILTSFGEPSTEDMNTLDQIYDAERTPIVAFRVIPLAHVSESYGLSSQVRDWIPPRWGGWRLEDVWLESSSAAGGSVQ